MQVNLDKESDKELTSQPNMEESIEDMPLKIISVTFDGEVNLDWNALPEKIRNNIELRDKIFDELKKRYPVEANIIVDSKFLFEANKYVLHRIKKHLGRL